MLKQHAQNLRENSYWMNIIKSDVLGYGDNNTDYENIVNGITLDDMKKFTKKLFNGKTAKPKKEEPYQTLFGVMIRLFL